jgi:hypothetical protein
MADELVKLVDAGTIRVIDVLILVKDKDGEIEAMELSDFADLGPLQVVEAQLAELLAEDEGSILPPRWILAAPRVCWSTRTCGRRRSHRRCAIRVVS